MKLSNTLWGMVLVVVGVIFGLNALDITNINIFFDGWWTLFIIIPSFIDLFKDKDKTGSLIGILIGICLLLACQGILSFSLIWKLFLPVLLVIFGLSLIFKDVISGKIKNRIKELNKNSDLSEYCATFGEQDLSFSGDDFNGCNLTAVFGGVKCDLRDVNMDKETIINAIAIFGGIDIFVPDDVVVKVKSFPIFGGVSNNSKNRKHDNKKVIYVNATCLFGGVEIK